MERNSGRAPLPPSFRRHPGAGGEVPVEVRQVSETTREADGYDFLISRAEQQFRALNPSVV